MLSGKLVHVVVYSGIPKLNAEINKKHCEHCPGVDFGVLALSQRFNGICYIEHFHSPQLGVECNRFHCL